MADTTTDVLLGIEAMILRCDAWTNRVPVGADPEDFIHFHEQESELLSENVPRPFCIIDMEQRSDRYVEPGCSFTDHQITVRLSDNAKFQDDNNRSFKDWAAFVGSMMDQLTAQQQDEHGSPPMQPMETLQTFQRTRRRDRKLDYDFWGYSFRISINPGEAS